MIQKPTGKQTKWGPEMEYCGFTIEKKLYTTSPDSCKIDFASTDRIADIKLWLEKIMGSEKPKPRFKISDVSP